MTVRLSIVSGVTAILLLASCKPSDVLSVPAPTGVLPASSLASQSGAEQVLANGAAYLSSGFGQYYYGVLEWSGQLADELRWSDFTYISAWAGVDARITEGVGGFQEVGDHPLVQLMAGRIALLTAIPLLEQYEPASGRAKIGLAYALTGYTELLVAEDYCAGLPLTTPTSTGLVYGTPLTTDSLLGAAEAHFDSAVKYAGSDPVAAPLAAIGLGRARLNRANFAGAASAVAGVPTSFVYNTELQPGGFNTGGLTVSNMYEMWLVGTGCGLASPVDKKGENGLNYLTANDPRLVFDTSLIKTCDGLYSSAADSVYYHPVKFGNPSTAIPIATGAEARLIEAEAALHAGQVGTWAADLNALRANAPDTYLKLAAGVPPLSADSTTTASAATQVDVLFRERAFWLYGMGFRLGDMRRLVRQYGRDQSTVFPVGPFPGASYQTLPSPVPDYKTDVNLTLPTGASGLSDPNVNYKGCISKAA